MAINVEKWSNTEPEIYTEIHSINVVYEATEVRFLEFCMLMSRAAVSALC